MKKQYVLDEEEFKLLNKIYGKVRLEFCRDTNAGRPTVLAKEEMSGFSKIIGEES